MNLPFSLIRPFYEKTSFHRSVIEDIRDEELRHAYSHCRAITKFHAKTFYMATRFLPNEKQRGVFAIYGMCRYLDNLVDDAEDLIYGDSLSEAQIQERLDLFVADLKKIYKGIHVDHPILIALADTINSYQIPIEYPMLLVEGVRQDLTKNRFQTFQEVYDYSFRVASVVGLMTSEIFGYSTKDALDQAVDLGIAMQLTNILRDIGEDLSRDRIYLAQDELVEFNVTEAMIINKVNDDSFKSMMKFQIERAKSYYDSAFQGIQKLNKDSRLPVYLAHRNYSRILEKIEENNYDVYSQRAYLNQSEKLSILPQVFLDLQKAS